MATAYPQHHLSEPLTPKIALKMPDIWLPSPGPCREDPEAGHHETAATKVELADTYRTLAGLRLSSPTI